MKNSSNPPIIPLFLTEGKKLEIQMELKDLEKNILPTIRKRLAIAYEDGDIPENNPFITAHEDLQKAMKRRNELRELLMRSKLYTPHKEHGVIHLGSTVVIRINAGATQSITLVESEEANPEAGKISTESPLGKALLGQKAGSHLLLPTPSGTQRVEILP